MKDSLQNRIDLWLEDRREASAGGGWAQITDEDVYELKCIVYDLIVEKCAPDADGDRPVQVILINRRKHRPLHHAHVAYEGDYRHVVEPLLDNVRRACDALNNEMECRAREGIRAGKKLCVTSPGSLVLACGHWPRLGTVMGCAEQCEEGGEFFVPVLWEGQTIPTFHSYSDLKKTTEVVKDEE